MSGSNQQLTGTAQMRETVQLARRLDWRFLLATPDLGRVALLGPAPNTLRDALQCFARELVLLDGPVERGGGSEGFDVVVLHQPSLETVRQAAALLKVGGWLYLEARGPLPRPGEWLRHRTLPNDYVNAMKEAGLAQVDAHWQWPDAERCTKLLPLDDPAALLYFLAQEPHPLLAPLKRGAGQLLGRSRLLPLLLPAYNITANRPALSAGLASQAGDAAMGRLSSQPVPTATHEPTRRFTWVREWEALHPHGEAWNALAARSATNRIFQTFEWNESWWQTWGQGRELWVLLAEEGDSLVGVAPMVLVTKRVYGVKQQVLELIGFGVADYYDFLVEPDREDLLEGMLDAISDSGPSWDLLFIPYLIDTSPTFHALPRFFRRRHLGVDTRERYEAPTRCFGEDPEEDRKLPRKKSLKRHFNYFARTGTVEFHNLRSAEEIAPYLDTLFRQHIERRAQTMDPSRFVDPEHREFYRNLTREMGPTGWLLFSVVHFEGQPIALHYGFEYQNRLLWYKPTFDIALASQSPGEVLIKYMLEYALESGLDEFDFSIGEEDFKYRFANQTRQTHAVHVFRKRLPYFLFRTLENTKERLKRSPRIRAWGHRAMRRLEAAQRAVQTWEPRA